MDLGIAKKIELEILQVIINVLTSNNIPYYVSYGSCLGAVRHKGFIPWDDDIDISLFRDDYERARECFLRQLPKEYLYVDNRTEDGYPYNFGKVRKRNTAFVHGGDAHLNIHHGIYVDIFPLDYAFQRRKDTVKNMKRIKRLRYVVDLCSMNYSKYGKQRPLWQLPLILFAHLFFNKKKTLRKIDKLITTTTNKSEYVCCYLTPYFEKDIYSISIFGIGSHLQFENLRVIVPEKYDEYLTQLYGDYMQFPPVEKRESHHDVIFISDKVEYHPNMFGEVINAFKSKAESK